MFGNDGKGFLTTNLKMMMLFYNSFPISRTLSGQSKKDKEIVIGWKY